MNDIEIAAGPEMDRLIAEKVMGWKWTGTGGVYERPGHPGLMVVSGPPTWSPSTEIAAAWEVAQKVDLFKNCRHLREDAIGVKDGAKWTRTGWRWIVVAIYEPLDHNDIIGFGETAPLAICRAALRVAEELKAAEEGA